MSAEHGIRSRDPRASPRMRTALASSAAIARDDIATNSPLVLAPLNSSLVSPFSSFADCKPPLASKHVDVAPAPWCAPQVRATIAPVSRVSCTSCSTPTPRSSSLARGHSFPWTFSYLWTYSLPIRMFPFSFFILRLVALPFSFSLAPFAIGLRLPPLLSTSRFHFEYRIPLRIRCRALCRRQDNTLWTSTLLPPPSLSVAYIVSLRTRIV